VDVSQQRLDVAAVASTLKAYFRELSTPLFPTTISSLPEQIISVMRFLFSFLHRVSLHAADNKMGSANLALVFGPTLTRAPDSLDPRQLHNDVPSVNLLIQMCIDKHELIFGPNKDQKPAANNAPSESQAPREEEKPTPLLSTSPPAEPPTAPPTAPPTVSTNQQAESPTPTVRQQVQLLRSIYTALAQSNATLY